MSSFSTVVMTTLNRNINYKKNLKLQHFDIFKGFQVNKKICADKPCWSARLRTFYIPELNKKNRIVKYCRENSETTVFPPKSRNWSRLHEIKLSLSSYRTEPVFYVVAGFLMWLYVFYVIACFSWNGNFLRYVTNLS